MSLSDVDKSYNFDLVYGEHGGYLPPSPFFEGFLNADIDDDGYIVVCCGDCSVPVRFYVGYDGDVDGEGRNVVYRSFIAKDSSKIAVAEDYCYCEPCALAYDASAAGAGR